jgi:hypothetical protein
MSPKPNQPEFHFEELPPDPPKKKAPARTVNADTGNGKQNCKKGVAQDSHPLKSKVGERTEGNPEPEVAGSQDELDFIGEKSPLRGKVAEKAPSEADEKAPSVEEEKAPSYYLPVSMNGVVNGAGLKSLLYRHRQHEWASEKRIGGLLMVIDYFARKGPGTTKTPGTAMSSDLSREYVSTLKRAKKSSTIRQPLSLLVEIGILEIVQKAVIAPHRKTAARYRLHSQHGKPKKIEVMLSAQQRDKLKNAEERKEKRLNRKHSFRRQLLADLATVNLAPDGRNQALAMITKREKEANIRSLIEYIDGAKQRKISIDPCGTIHCFVRLAPKELKPHMMFNDEPVAICDLESAHVCALSCVIQERIDRLAACGMGTGDLEQERRSFIALLESVDIYEHLAEGGERKPFKKSLLASINMPTSIAIHIEAYQRFRREFPLTVGIIEDIKQKGHHGISRPLQFYTASIIKTAIGKAHAKEIPCIPDTDALIVPAIHESTVKAVMMRALFQVTGIDRRA